MRFGRRRKNNPASLQNSDVGLLRCTLDLEIPIPGEKRYGRLNHFQVLTLNAVTE